MKFLLVVLLFGVAVADENPTCPNGAEIYALGLDADQTQEAIDEQNKYRQMVLDDNVDDQPQGKDIPMLQFDNDLTYGAQVVVLTCQMTHKIEDDPQGRFSVGQNLFIQWNSNKIVTPDWPAAVKSWFDENKGYNYPEISDDALHYTQLVWANTTLVGCDFIAYYDKDEKKAKTPHARLYGCNYGAAGNVIGLIPYEEA